uniref:Uncharacterized protein n=1 Tax=Oryza meridionalis TaxID=40149 RepID=A0A0E0EH18_9ORYZ
MSRKAFISLSNSNSTFHLDGRSTIPICHALTFAKEDPEDPTRSSSPYQRLRTGQIGPKKPIHLFQGPIAAVVTDSGIGESQRSSRDEMSYSSLLPKLQVRANMPVGRVKLRTENRRLKDTLPKDKVELDELRVDLAFLRRGLCAKHFHLYKAVGKEDLYCAPILMRTQIAWI